MGINMQAEHIMQRCVINRHKESLVNRGLEQSSQSMGIAKKQTNKLINNATRKERKKKDGRRRERKIPVVHLQQLLLPRSVLICSYCMNGVFSHESPRYWEGTTHTDELQSNTEQ